MENNYIFAKNKKNLIFERFAFDKTNARALKHGFFYTIIIWTVFFVLFAILPVFQVKNHYTSVKIVLDSSPLQRDESSGSVKDFLSEDLDKKSEKTLSETVPPVSEVKNDVQPVKADVKFLEAKKENKSVPLQKTADDKNSVKSAPKSQSVSKQETLSYKKTAEELLAQQLLNKKSVEFDESLFDEDENVSVSESTSIKKVASISSSEALSGVAASVKNDNYGVTSKNVETAQSSKISSTASNLLNKISQTAYISSDSGGITSSASVNTAKNYDGRISMEMTDGSSRILIEPDEPKIFISETAGKTIDSSRQVTILMKVKADGTVPLSEISITPSSILSFAVQSEIRVQISKWRFSSADYDGHARFDYSIIKK